jgi:uncharacterized protein YcbX
MARIAGVRRYPIKGLDGSSVDAASITAAGTVGGDREYAVCDAGGEGEEPAVYNGKRSDWIYGTTTRLDPDTRVLTVAYGGDARRFDLSTSTGREAASEWFAGVIDADVALRRREPPGFVDRPDAGPSVVSTATLETVASWFDGLTVEGVRRRLRANVEVGGVPAFWEDRFVGTDAPSFVVGDGDDAVRFEGVEPCVRCVVPSRDPETGEPMPGFRERFVERRAATFPDWADRTAFPSDYALMLVARVPEASRGRTIDVGDPVWVSDDGERDE